MSAEISEQGLEPIAARTGDTGTAARHPLKAAGGSALPSYKPDRRAGILVIIGRFLVWLLMRQWLMRLARTCWPIPRFFGYAAVTRYDDVAEVLSRHDVFKVPFADEIARLNDIGENSSTPFLLGIDDEEAHDRQLKRVMQAFKRDDIARVARLSRRSADDLISKSIPCPSTDRRRIDAIRELITRVPIEVCREYFGVEIEEPQDFADATIDVSGHLFGQATVKPSGPIDRAAAYVRLVVDRAIAQENKKQKSGQPSGDDTVLTRLVGIYRKNSNQFTWEHVRAFLMGMIVGFIPTNTMVGGHVLEMLLRKEEFMDAAREAAAAGDDDLLERTLFEAMRFMPHNPVLFRICSCDYTVAAGTSRAKTIKEDTKVLAWTMSAMFDPRQVGRPREFDPHRPASDYMLLGYGMHWCAGVFIARMQITQTFKALLAQPNLKRAGRLQLRKLFPDHLFVEFDAVKP